MEISSITQALQLHAQLVKGINHENAAVSLKSIFTFSALSVSPGSLAYARSIFDSLPAPNPYFCNTLLRAYARSPEPDNALVFFLQLQRQFPHECPPDHYTFPFLLQSCSLLGAAPEGKQLHACICKAGLGGNLFVQNSLIHMYALCGELSSALTVFHKMPDRDVVSWTSAINGCVRSGNSADALRLFDEMIDAGVTPNDATAVSILKACGDLGAVGAGLRVHRIAVQFGFDSKPNVITSLIDMYCKSGCIDNAMKLFDGIPDRDVFAWTAMISGLASHGKSMDAIELFNRMQELQLRPDDKTITAVLSAYRNAGWVAEGRSFFKSMEKNYSIYPKIQHYGCMVDLLARGGYLNEAEELIRRMPIEPDMILWRTLIWACKIHGDFVRGARLMNENLLKGNDVDAGTYVLLGNMFASIGKWHEKGRLRGLMAQNRTDKVPGCSRIEVNGSIHEFVAGDSDHPEAERIYKKMREIAKKLRSEGYQPKLAEVLLDIEDSDKASQLQHHSEKIAVTFGLISTKPQDRILVVKNLRSCEDCHSAMKFVSKIYQREIIIRDRIRFHHFKNGVCSCRDYW